MMNVNSISSLLWNNTEAAKSVSPKNITASSEAEKSAPAGSGSETEEVTTKISVTPEGEKVMVFMQGDKVIRTIKIGSGEMLAANKAMSNEEQQYVDNGISDVGLMLNVGS